MTTSGLLLQENDLFVSGKFLKASGISAKTIECWHLRGTVERLPSDKEGYILYKSIPLQTRKKLPGEPALRAMLKDTRATDLRESLVKAFEFAKFREFTKYVELYAADSDLPKAKVTKCAQLHAVLTCLLDRKTRENLRDLTTLHEAFNAVIPGKYNNKKAFGNALRRAQADGIMSVALDKRAFGNNKELNSTKFTPLQKFWLANLVGHSSKFSCTQIHEKLCKVCEAAGRHKPSLSWVKKWRKEQLQNPALYEARYGQQETAKVLPFASMKTASHSNCQWQMDGWTLPFWGPKFKRFVLVRIIDSYSKKVLGYGFGESETTTVILEAVRDAISNTGQLPLEVVTDNHAFNKTSEAQNLIDLLARKGCRWTVTSNPQHKSFVERYNQHLDALCKEYYGYLGQGIRSKSIEALAKPELLDQYAKSFVSFEEQRAIVAAIVETYNTNTGRDGKSPNERFESGLPAHPIEASIFDRAELLTAQAEKKVSRGQITIMRGPVKHEFQLPARHFMAYNGRTVLVRYEDLNEGVYLFDKATGASIEFVPPKTKISGALADQGEADTEAFHKHKGRLNGVSAKARKELDQLTADALATDPEAYALLNRLTTPKDVVKELEENAQLRRAAEDKGVRPELIYVPARPGGPGLPTALQPKESKKESGPFSVKNHSIALIDPTNLLEDEE